MERKFTEFDVRMTLYFGVILGFCLCGILIGHNVPLQKKTAPIAVERSQTYVHYNTAETKLK